MQVKYSAQHKQEIFVGLVQNRIIHRLQMEKGEGLVPFKQHIHWRSFITDLFHPFAYSLLFQDEHNSTVNNWDN